MSWWELTAAASSTLGIHALLALAADPASGEHEVIEVDAAYMPWICAASTMLDSYVDSAQDALQQSHSYIAHYPSSRLRLSGPTSWCDVPFTRRAFCRAELVMR